jgi:hypothetical protein
VRSQSVLDSVGALSALLGTVDSLFMKAVLEAAAPLRLPAAAEGAAAEEGGVVPAKEEASASVEESFVLPRCTSWIEDGPAAGSGSGSSRPAQLVRGDDDARTPYIVSFRPRA